MQMILREWIISRLRRGKEVQPALQEMARLAV